MAYGDRIGGPAVFASPAVSREAGYRHSIYTLPERHKHMPEEKKSFMEELDRWDDTEIFEPLAKAWLAYQGAPEGTDAAGKKAGIRETESIIKRLVRQKVLDSYRNGQRVPAKTEQRGGRYGR